MKDYIPRTTDIDLFFEYGVYLPTATIYFGSTYFDEWGNENGVDFDSTARFIKGLHLLDYQSECDQITIILNNPGGEEFHMFAIYDAIKNCSKWINIECYGHAMSAASIIMQAGNKRLISSNSYMMIHDGDWGYQGDPTTAKRWAKIGVDICERMYTIYHSRMKEKDPNITINKIGQICKHDTIYTAQQSIDAGLVDEIIEEFDKKDPFNKSKPVIRKHVPKIRRRRRVKKKKNK